MKGYRKTKKKGGNVVYRCPIKSNPSDCIQRYLREADIELIHITPDGNCFFNSIATYFKLNGRIVSPMELRERVISYMEEHREEYEPFFIVDSEKSSVKKATMTRQFTQLKKSGSWNSQLADFIPQEAPKALDINILLYEVSESGETISTNLLRDDTKSLVVTEKYPTVHVLRVNRNHYELLRPVRRRTNNLLNESESKTKTSTKTTTATKTSAATKKNRKQSLSENEIKAFEKQFQTLQIKENEEVAKKLVKEYENEEKKIKEAKERNEKIRQHYLKKKQGRNAETKRLLEEYQRLSNLGAFN